MIHHYVQKEDFQYREPSLQQQLYSQNHLFDNHEFDLSMDIFLKCAFLLFFLNFFQLLKPLDYELVVYVQNLFLKMELLESYLEVI